MCKLEKNWVALLKLYSLIEHKKNELKRGQLGHDHMLVMGKFNIGKCQI